MTLAGALLGLHAQWQFELLVRLGFALTVVCIVALAVRAMIPEALVHARHGVASWALVACLAAPFALGVMPAMPIIYGLPESMVHVDNLPRVGPTRSVLVGAIGQRDAVASPESASRGPGPFAWIALAWLGGAMLILGRVAIGRRRLLRALRDGPPPAREVLGAVRAGRRAMEISDPVLVVGASAVGCAFTRGHRRPLIALPAGCALWSRETLQAVVWHELAHVRHRHWAWQICGTAACVMFWFHPLVWWLAGMQRHDAELAADAEAVRAGVRPAAYARALVSVAMQNRAAVGARGGLESAIALAPSSGLEARLRAVRARLADGRAPGARPGAFTVAPLLLLGTMATTAIVAPILEGGCHDHEIRALRDEAPRA